MHSIEEVLEQHGETISRLGYGRRALADWLNDNLDGHYTVHFARRLLGALDNQDAFRATTVRVERVAVAPEETQDDDSIEDRLRRAYGITDPSWVPVGIWGEPHAPKAKWERKNAGPDLEKVRDLIDKTQVDKTQTMVAELTDPYIAVLSLRDTHFGMFTNAPEPYDTYSLEEATQAYVEAGVHLIDNATEFGAGTLVIPFGSDMLHVDGAGNTTTRGTPQEVSGPWYEAFAAAMKALNEVIDYALSEGLWVILVLEPGNHDANLALAMGEGIKAKWDGRVSYIGGQEGVKRVTFGNTHLFFHHGDSIKPEDYPRLIANDHPDTVGNGHYVEVLSGHLHHRRRSVLGSSGDYLEAGSLVHRITPALCPSSNWAERMGFRSDSGSQLTLYNHSGFVALFEWRR